MIPISSLLASLVVNPKVLSVGKGEDDDVFSGSSWTGCIRVLLGMFSVEYGCMEQHFIYVQIEQS
jgi:hypothetical protein